MHRGPRLLAGQGSQGAGLFRLLSPLFLGVSSQAQSYSLGKGGLEDLCWPCCCVGAHCIQGSSQALAASCGYRDILPGCSWVLLVGPGGWGAVSSHVLCDLGRGCAQAVPLVGPLPGNGVGATVGLRTYTWSCSGETGSAKWFLNFIACHCHLEDLLKQVAWPHPLQTFSWSREGSKNVDLFYYLQVDFFD